MLGKGKLIPRYHPVEIRIGRVITSEELRRIASDGTGAGAYRKLADYMRQAVVTLGERSAAPIKRGHATKAADDREPPAASHGVRNGAGRRRAKA